MPGPYFPGQEAAACGCYFPDVTLVRDELATGNSILYCITHHEVVEAGASQGLAEPEPIPDDEWRESMREILRRGGQ